MNLPAVPPVSVLTAPCGRDSSACVADLLHGALPVIDVRSPREFAGGHIPGALNVPLFSDAERDQIGRIYKHSGSERAIEWGLDVAAQRTASLLKQTRDAIQLDSEFIVHCWRGGMRSAGFAWLCSEHGMQPKRLRGGYKAFRQASRDAFAARRNIIVLAGLTGSGKTRILHELQNAGEQVIDLEGLARHRGSIFGGLGQPPQPSGEQFENELFVRWQAMNPTGTLWIEGESRSIGRVQIPQSIWQQMSTAPLVFLEVDRRPRIDFLVGEYGQMPNDELAAAIKGIGKRLGGVKLKIALESLQRGDFHAVAEIALSYYDKLYLKSLQKRPTGSVTRVQLNRAADPSAVQVLRRFANQPSLLAHQPE